MTTNIVTHRPSTAKTATEERRQLALDTPHDTCECCDAEEGVIDGLCIDCRAADAEHRANLDDEY